VFLFCSDFLQAEIPMPQLSTLPRRTEGLVETTKLTTGIAVAIASVFLPGVGVIGPIAEYAINKFVKEPEMVLISKIKKGNVQLLDEEHAAAFIPMAYKFFEVAKEGEYEHNIRILAELLANEMREPVPDVSGFARLSRRIEGLTIKDLEIIALIDAVLQSGSGTLKDSEGGAAPYLVSAFSLSNNDLNKENFDRVTIQECLSDLSSRGLLIAEGASRFDKAEEYYYPSSSFRQLVEKARDSLNTTRPEGAAQSTV
jgi:hypothetical protein